MRAAVSASPVARPVLFTVAPVFQPLLIELDHNALFHAIKKEAFHASILEMELGGKEQKVLLRDLQMHPFKQQILHIDFQRVEAKYAK